MLRVAFAFVCEGPSDAPLLSHLRSLVISAGADVVEGEQIAVPSTSVEGKIRRVQGTMKPYDLLFVHRDADSRNSEPRYEEILRAARLSGWRAPVVCVVPVQATESWLLTSEQAIRDVAGRSLGSVPLGLPPISRIEQTARPKDLLREAYLAATEATGRRRRMAEKKFSERRAALIERLDISGGVAQLSSFQRLVRDVQRAVDLLRNVGV